MAGPLESGSGGDPPADGRVMERVVELSDACALGAAAVAKRPPTVCRNAAVPDDGEVGGFAFDAVVLRVCELPLLFELLLVFCGVCNIGVVRVSGFAGIARAVATATASSSTSCLNKSAERPKGNLSA